MTNSQINLNKQLNTSTISKIPKQFHIKLNNHTHNDAL